MPRGRGAAIPKRSRIYTFWASSAQSPRVLFPAQGASCRATLGKQPGRRTGTNCGRFFFPRARCPFPREKGSGKGKLPNIGRRGQETRLPPEVWLEVWFLWQGARSPTPCFKAVPPAPLGRRRQFARRASARIRRYPQGRLAQGPAPRNRSEKKSAENSIAPPLPKVYQNCDFRACRGL